MMRPERQNFGEAWMTPRPSRRPVRETGALFAADLIMLR
jgi:hypothetical protein